MNKSKLAFLAVAVGAMVLTACGGNGKETSKSTKSRPSIEIPSEVESSLEPLKDPTVIINGGAAQTVTRGTPLTKPADPTAPTGKKFYGWKNVKNGGQIWNFDSEVLNQVWADVELVPCFINDVEAQYLEAEMCPSIQEANDGDGMPGSTYSGGQKGKGLIYHDKDNSFGGTTSVDSVSYYKSKKWKKFVELDDPKADLLDDKELIHKTLGYGAFVEFMYVCGDTLTFKVNASEAATGVQLFGRFSGEYGIKDSRTDEIVDTFNDTEFKVTVNGTRMEYGEIAIHNIPLNRPTHFQDFYLGEISLAKGENIIEAKVDNHRTLNGTIEASAPVIDSLKLFGGTTISMTNIKNTNMTEDNELD